MSVQVWAWSLVAGISYCTHPPWMQLRSAEWAGRGGTAVDRANSRITV